MDEDVKLYRFAREYRKSLIPSEKEKKQALKANLFEKFRILKDKLQVLEKDEQNKGTIEVAEELVEKCEESYGKDLKRLYETENNDWKLESLYNIARRIINDLGKYEQQEKSSLEIVEVE